MSNEIEFEMNSNLFDVAITGTVNYSIFENEVYIDDFDYEVECDYTLDTKDNDMIYDEVQNYVANLEIEIDEPYDTTFEKYM